MDNKYVKKIILFWILLLFCVLPKDLFAQVGPPMLYETPINELKTEFRPMFPDPLGYHLFPNLFARPQIVPVMFRINVPATARVSDGIDTVENSIGQNNAWGKLGLLREGDILAGEGGLADILQKEVKLRKSEPKLPKGLKAYTLKDYKFLCKIRGLSIKKQSKIFKRKTGKEWPPSKERSEYHEKWAKWWSKYSKYIKKKVPYPPTGVLRNPETVTLNQCLNPTLQERWEAIKAMGTVAEYLLYLEMGFGIVKGAGKVIGKKLFMRGIATSVAKKVPLTVGLPAKIGEFSAEKIGQAIISARVTSSSTKGFITFVGAGDCATAVSKLSTILSKGKIFNLRGGHKIFLYGGRIISPTEGQWIKGIGKYGTVSFGSIPEHLKVSISSGVFTTKQWLEWGKIIGLKYNTNSLLKAVGLVSK